MNFAALNAPQILCLCFSTEFVVSRRPGLFVLPTRYFAFPYVLSSQIVRPLFKILHWEPELVCTEPPMGHQLIYFFLCDID
jgi:hypothetical protein